jgi:glucokinase
VPRPARRAGGGVLLAGDIGGTKALLALYGPQGMRFERRYPCGDFAAFDALLERFRADARAALGAPPRIARAVFGVAGPVAAGRVRLTHLDWEIDARALGIETVRLVNDFVADALGLAALGASDLATLQPGAPEAAAPRLLIGAGTGLGVAFVVGRGRSLRVVGGEGGHAAFAPADEQQEALLRHLRPALGRIELEHVISGAGLARIYDFLRHTGRGRESAALRAALAAGAGPAAITHAALEAADPLALAAIDLFIACYGAAAGDYALAVLARGGVYVTGGVAPKILARLRAGGFVAAFNAKGAFAEAARACPVHVVTNERLGLLGAVSAAPK